MDVFAAARWVGSGECGSSAGETLCVMGDGGGMWDVGWDMGCGHRRESWSVGAVSMVSADRNLRADRWRSD
eukprot:scaffold11862_cov74-Cyclotella_meneghiniana.AAC.10